MAAEVDRSTFDDPPIGVFEQPARYSGQSFEIIERVGTIEEAARVADGIRSGRTDPFLARAWTRLAAYKPRRKDGTFEKGFVVQMEFVRPGAGESSM